MGLNLKYGNNVLTKNKISDLLKNNITWNSFVWYISDYSYIKSFGEDWILVNIVSDKQANFLDSKVLNYNEKVEVENYLSNINKEDALKNKKGAKTNLKILEKLVS